MAGFDLVGLIVVLLPFYLIWSYFQKSAKEKPLDEYIASCKKICMVVGLLMLLVNPEMWIPAIAIVALSMIMGNGKSSFLTTFSNWLTKKFTEVWNKNNPSAVATQK